MKLNRLQALSLSLFLFPLSKGLYHVKPMMSSLQKAQKAAGYAGVHEQRGTERQAFPGFQLAPNGPFSIRRYLVFDLEVVIKGDGPIFFCFSLEPWVPRVRSPVKPAGNSR